MLALVPFSVLFAAPPQYGFGAHSFGTEIKGGGTSFDSSPTALAGVCSFTTGVSNRKTVTGVDLSPVLNVGAISTTGSTMALTPGHAATATAQVMSVSLLGGTITADTASSTSESYFDGLHLNVTFGSTFTNLVVLGVSYPSVTSNTTIALPLYGSVTVDERIGAILGNSVATGAVNAIHVRITVFPNPLSLPIGTEIIVAQSYSKDVQARGLITGRANDIQSFGLSPDVGPIEENVIPCGGIEYGKLLTRTASGLTSSLMTTGPLTTTAQGVTYRLQGTPPFGSNGETTASVTSLDLLNGLITADLVEADSHATAPVGPDVLSDTGSTFLNLKVAGTSYPDNTPANTQLALPGLGNLYLHRVVQTHHKITVTMVDLIVTVAPNAYSLPLGAEITVGTATTKIVH